jgi:hypothetical protein
MIPILSHPMSTISNPRIIRRLKHMNRGIRWGWRGKWHTLDRGMNQGGNHPKSTLSVIVLDVVPVGQNSWSADEGTLSSSGGSRGEDAGNRGRLLQNGSLPIPRDFVDLELGLGDVQLDVVDSAFNRRTPLVQ